MPDTGPLRDLVDARVRPRCGEDLGRRIENALEVAPRVRPQLDHHACRDDRLGGLVWIAAT